MQARNLLNSNRKVVASTATVVALAVGGATAIVWTQASSDTTAEHHEKPTAGTTTHAHPTANEPTAIARTSDPETFALSVARTLFAWDTTGPSPLNEYTGRLLAVADPSGEESAGLATDLTTYLPSPESWDDLKTYDTRQWIDITSYEVPDDWNSALDNPKGADVAAGTTAYTITGLRRRSGIWQGKTAKTVDEVSFTIFMTCRPTYDTCRLLRLSQLNNPLR